MTASTTKADVQTRLRQFLEEVHSGKSTYNAADVPAGQAILALPPAEQIEIVLASFAHAGSEADDRPLVEKWADPRALDAQFLMWLRGAILEQTLPWDEQQIAQLAKSFCRDHARFFGLEDAIIGAFERFAKDRPLPLEAIKELTEAEIKLAAANYGALVRPWLKRLAALRGTTPRLRIIPGEVWADAALDDIGSAEPKERVAWIALLDHCAQASASAPTLKWLKTAGNLLETLGRDMFRARLVAWLPLIDKPRPGENQPIGGMTLLDVHLDLLKGLAWCCGTFDDRELARALGFAAVSAYKKLPGIGPRAVKLGNACVYALGAMPGAEGLAQLALLKVKVKFGTAQKGIEKALTAVAERLGLPRDEIEELAVPTYGMDEVGLRREELGEFTAELRAGADGSTELLWRKADGKIQKSVPAAVSGDHAEELKELKGAAKDIQRMLPAQRERIDNLFLAQKRWPLATWRERYLDHPLVGLIARKLIWRFSSDGHDDAGIWHDGRIVNAHDQPLEPGDESTTTVALWHPIGLPMDDVLAWRAWLDRHEVRQPFKQAHREVYLLTDAERRTGTYSNRFAAHILKQHQFNALCAARGWKNKLRLMVDDAYPPASRSLPQHGLRAEFWVEGAGDAYGTDTNETGTFLYLATDQVRFYRIDAPQLYAHAGGGGYGAAWSQAEPAEPVPLDQIPPLVFSEILRDVDLFVGVASVGNDPSWADGGHEGRHVDYWQSYSFGDLSATAATRKAVLETTIPRLKIADRCSFDDRFLVVAGKLRTYKIHLGSGNILMEPNDQYLCIVPSRSSDVGAGKVFLPFEGDRTLSIVLSKALLLADDDKITDTTITSQISRG